MRKLLPFLDPIALWQENSKFRYLLIGAWNTLAGYAIFAGLYFLIGTSIGYLATAALSHVLAVTQSFAAQRNLVFRSQGNGWAEYVRFHIAHLGSLMLGLTLLPLQVELLGIAPLIAQALVTALIVILSYFVHQHFTFRTSSDEN